MDFDLDLFDRKDHRSSRRRDRDRDDRDDRQHQRARSDVRRDDRDRDYGRDDRDRGRSRDDRPRDGRDRDHRRRAHPHVFAWLLIAGGGVAVVLLLIGLASALGIWGHIADGYFAAARAILPTSWHDEWMALPGFAHVGLSLTALFVALGLAGELLD